MRRWGGNATSRYHWKLDAYSAGADWYFENLTDANPNPATLPDGSAADRFVEQDRRTATRTLLSAPMLGWVAKRRLTSHPFDCGFKVSKYGAQQSTDPWDADCGNGVTPGGARIVGNDPTDTSVASDPAFVAEWVQHLVGKYGTAAGGGVAYYALDNEPALWNSTHRDVHPQPAGFAEIRDRGVAYAAAIKAVDPSARTLGPVEWGWCAYFYSAADPGGCSPGSDYQAHGNVPFVAWYLAQMRAYEQQHGVRLLDYLDLHYYPAAPGVALAPAGSATTQALRLRSTRSLWDPAYIDESWISDLNPGGTAVALIPRMKAWVAANYPGTRLAITEYNWGAPESVNGALAQADVVADEARVLRYEPLIAFAELVRGDALHWQRDFAAAEAALGAGLELALASGDERVAVEALARRIYVRAEILGEPARALADGDLPTLATAMNQSHFSMRYYFEITIPAIDFIVESARLLGATGARMTGGGFGGSVVALVPTGAVDTLTATLPDAVEQAGHPRPTVRTMRAGAGAHLT